MARSFRIHYPGAIYHVMNRGDRRQDSFADDQDRQGSGLGLRLHPGCRYGFPLRMFPLGFDGAVRQRFLSLRITLLVTAVLIAAATCAAEPRWVRIACTQGPDLEHYGLPAFARALDVAGQHHADLALMPEYMNGEMVPEPLAGPSARLMSKKARQYRMYVAGTIERIDDSTSTRANTALLFDRQGKLVGTYDKIHLFGDELKGNALTPGSAVPVFQTDFGKVAFVTCNDIAFSDVATNAVAKGAEVLLFPSLGYDRTVARSRAAQLKCWLIGSSRSGEHNAWSPEGVNVMATTAQEGVPFRDVVKHQDGELRVLLATLRIDSAAHDHPDSGAPAPAESRRGITP
jgi:predicted amidohydrolase